MRKRVIVEGCVLSRSGYGEHARMILRALRSREDDLFDIFVIPLAWGKTGWLSDNTEERAWIEEKIKRTAEIVRFGIPFDVHIFVGLPNEVKRRAPKCFLVTAGIETNKVCDQWAQASHLVDQIIVPSEHAKQGFLNAGNTNTNIEVVSYPVRTSEPDPNFNLELSTDFNFLVVSQWAERKNLTNTIEWFLEKYWNHKNVGLVLKINFVKNCTKDREFCMNRLKHLLNKHDKSECKIYLLHGDMTENELSAMYQHPKIKAIVSATHGEGFGLPLFEAATYGLPVVAPDWSAHTDFLKIPGSKQSHFTKVDFTIEKVQQVAHWQNVITEDMFWCFPQKTAFQKALENVRFSHDEKLKQARELAEYLKSTLSEASIYDKVAKLIFGEEAPIESILEF